MQAKYPQGLSVLFLTEMWERFGFYTAQALLILYMTKAFSFSDSKGYAILGAFTALAYILPVLGGYVAGHLLGYQKTVFLGNIFLAIGYGLLIIPGQFFFYIALALIVVGTGLFKPNISSLLGTFYHKDDPYRDSGFTIFYVGINFGVMLATSLSGYIQLRYGWHVAFGAAMIGLILGLIIFVVGQKRINLSIVESQHISTSMGWLKNKFVFTIMTLLVFLGSWAFIKYGGISNFVLLTMGIFLMILLIVISFRFPKKERNKLLGLISLIITSIIFWAIYFQIFFSSNLFIDRNVDRYVFGYQLPTPLFIGLESFFILILGPIFARLWIILSERQKKPSPPFKFALATLVVGLAFLILYIGIHFTSQLGLMSPWWIVFAYFLITVSELLLSPIGLSIVTTLAPTELVGVMMGMWFVALGLGGQLAGVLAKYSAVPQNLKGGSQETIPYYAHAFLLYFILASVTGIVILLIVPFIKKLIRGENIISSNS